MTFEPGNCGGPYVIEDALPPRWCTYLVETFRQARASPRSYQGVVDRDLRECEFVEVPERSAASLSDLVETILQGACGLRTRATPDQPQVIYRYGPGVGFTTHHDEVTETEVERAAVTGQPVLGGDVTVVCLLNSRQAYAGGALYFESPVQVELRPPRGSLVAFPATRDFLHGVRPIEGGERFVAVVRRTLDSSVSTE